MSTPDGPREGDAPPAGSGGAIDETHDEASDGIAVDEAGDDVAVDQTGVDDVAVDEAGDDIVVNEAHPEGADDAAAEGIAVADEMSRNELGSAAIAGARWVAFSRMIYEVVAFGSTIALTRLVAPAEFGSAAVALVLPMLATILSYEGFGSALVQRKTINDALEGAAVFMSVVSGLVLSGLAASFALVAAPSIFGDRTAELLLLISPVFALAGFTSVPRARLQRRLEFRALSLNDVYSFSANIAVAIPLAALDFGGKALVIGLLAGQVVGTFTLVHAAGLPAPRFANQESREILRYGLPASGGGIVYSARTSMPWLVLGASLAPALVGQYYRAFQLGAEYQAKFGNVMLAVVFPVFSRAADLADLQALRRKAVRTSALVITPALGLLIVTAPEVVAIMYGPKWSGAVEATQILALVGMVQALMSGTEGLMLALNKPRQLLVFHVGFALFYLVTLLAVVRGGDLVEISAVTVGVYVVMLVISQRYLVQRYAGLPFRELFFDAGPPMLSTAAAVGVGALLAGLLRDASVPAFPLVLLVGLAGAAVYAAALRLAFRGTWSEARRLPGLLRKR